MSRGLAGRRVALAAGLTMAFAAGCDGRSAEPTLSARYLPGDTQASPTAVIHGVTYELDAVLWRDFMPTSGPEGSPLHASIQIRARGGPIAPTFELVSPVVVFGGRMWRPRLTPGFPSDSLRAYDVAGGPRWGPGGMADVYAYAYVTGVGRWLRRAGVPIGRTD